MKGSLCRNNHKFCCCFSENEWRSEDVFKGILFCLEFWIGSLPLHFLRQGRGFLGDSGWEGQFVPGCTSLEGRGLQLGMLLLDHELTLVSWVVAVAKSIRAQFQLVCQRAPFPKKAGLACPGDAGPRHTHPSLQLGAGGEHSPPPSRQVEKARIVECLQCTHGAAPRVPGQPLQGASHECQMAIGQRVKCLSSSTTLGKHLTPQAHPSQQLKKELQKNQPESLPLLVPGPSPSCHACLKSQVSSRVTKNPPPQKNPQASR